MLIFLSVNKKRKIITKLYFIRRLPWRSRQRPRTGSGYVNIRNIGYVFWYQCGWKPRKGERTWTLRDCVSLQLQTSLQNFLKILPTLFGTMEREQQEPEWLGGGWARGIYYMVENLCQICLQLASRNLAVNRNNSLNISITRTSK